LYLWHWFCFKYLGFTYIISNPVVKRIKVLYQISRFTTYEAAQILIRVLVLNILMTLIFLYGNSDKQYFSFVFIVFSWLWCSIFLNFSF
jgi:hypothetical protein